MRTLTKEKVNLLELANSSGALSMDLIGDGPNEVASQLISKFHQTNQELQLKQRENDLATKDKYLRRSFALAFIESYTSMFNITREQMGELACGIKEENIRFIENNLAERLRKRARVLISTSIISGGGFIYSIASWFLTGELHIAIVPFIIFGWLLPFLILVSLIQETEVPFSCISYIQNKKRLKKKYGPDYFPVQELREELKLIEK